MMTGEDIAKLLLTWYQVNKRDLPWRRTDDPYSIVVSEFMLHQTQVSTALPYYQRFLRRFPDWTTLAQAELDDVLKVWEGLGYYARARHLHRLAQQVCSEHGGLLPTDASALRRLPGVGEYTVGAILSLVFGRDAIAVDGNSRRVLSRLTGLRVDPTKGEGKLRITQIAESLLPSGQAADFNQALMDLGAAICLPRQPHCSLCPLQSACQAQRDNLQAQLPVRPVAKTLPHYDIGVGLIWHHERLLIARRPPKGLLGGLWEFPGGKCEQGESLPECVLREIREELNIEVEVGQPMTVVKHAYTHFRVTLHFFHCQYLSGEVYAINHTAWKWVSAQELPDYAFPAANHAVIAALQAESVAPQKSKHLPG